MLQFICIGTQKGGTTTLGSYLRAHPQLILPRQHELHFFDDENQNWEAPDLDRYHSDVYHHDNPVHTHLPHQSVSDIKICGEVTPIYMYWLPSIERIYYYNPSIKLIALLRNPMARAYSHWAMEIARGNETEAFATAIRAEANRCLRAAPLQHRIYSYIDRGRYHQQIMRLLRFFPWQQIMILRSEEFFAHPIETLQRIQTFLGIAQHTPARVEHERKGSYTDPMSLDDWTYIYRELEGEISGLEKLLGWDCSEWRVPRTVITERHECESSLT